MIEEKFSFDSEGLVSVVIPVYNARPYIAQCLESVRRQIYENLEIILVDDGSTDGTADYCDKIALLDSRITVLHQANEGVVSARNAGVRFAHGSYLVFVDADDWIDGDMIAEMVGQIGKADMVSAGVYQELRSGQVIEHIDRFRRGVYKGKEDMEYLYGKMIYDHETESQQPLTPWIYNKLYICSKVKEIHENISRDLVLAEDTVFLYLYMLECKSIVICDRCFYHYRYVKESASHRVNENKLADLNKVYLALAEIFRRHSMSTELLYQLQKWIAVKSCIAINSHMGFDRRVHIPEFIADLGQIGGGVDKEIILYGAGVVGCDTFMQMKAFGFSIVLWVDTDYGRYQELGMPVSCPKKILSYNYDLVLIAVADGNVAEDIKKSLLIGGVPENKIIWRKPLKLH